MSLSFVLLDWNIVFQEFHLNNYGGKRKKIKITLEVCDVVQTTNKHQLKTNLDPPPRARINLRDAAGAAPQRPEGDVVSPPFLC